MYSLSKKTVIFFLFFAGIIFSIYFLFFNVTANFPEGKIVTVRSGSTLEGISELLKSEDLIRSKVLFKFFVVLYGGEKHLLPGDFLFDKKIPVWQVARRIARADWNLDLVKITVPEGFDSSTITKAVYSKFPSLDQDAFLMQARKKEGYLFPDTYFFFPSAVGDEMLNMMSDNFDKKTKSLMNDINSSGHSLRDIVTMASIIEREAKGDVDRKIISGILWKRLSKSIPLQVDAAPETYKKRGLIETPICNPGIEAIYAALHPEDSPYLYYLHDRTGTAHFAVTFAEHNSNMLRYLR